MSSPRRPTEADPLLPRGPARRTRRISANANVNPPRRPLGLAVAATGAMTPGVSGSPATATPSSAVPPTFVAASPRTATLLSEAAANNDATPVGRSYISHSSSAVSRASMVPSELTSSLTSAASVRAMSLTLGGTPTPTPTSAEPARSSRLTLQVQATPFDTTLSPPVTPAASSFGGSRPGTTPRESALSALLKSGQTPPAPSSMPFATDSAEIPPVPALSISSPGETARAAADILAQETAITSAAANAHIESELTTGPFFPLDSALESDRESTLRHPKRDDGRTSDLSADEDDDEATTALLGADIGSAFFPSHQDTKKLAEAAADAGHQAGYGTWSAASTHTTTSATYATAENPASTAGVDADAQELGEGMHLAAAADEPWRKGFLPAISYAGGEIASVLPAVSLGVILNILDSISFGMIVFPLSDAVFADLGSDGIAI
ncbi:hypothetical protein H9P43_003763 [Blastocladiella emersonii ATCC 22665]|nr:hypothetical protein H9P43_003763 [Blastocladiella emersonii ATCC 22665]